MVFTSFALSLWRNWSARVGEQHSVRGLEFYCWRSLEQSYVAVNTAACASRKQIGEGCRGSCSRFCGLRNTQWPAIVPDRSGVPEQAWILWKSYKTLLYPSARGGWVAVVVPGVWWVLSSQSQASLVLPAWQFSLFDPIISSLFPLLLSQACRQAVQIKRSALGRFWISEFDKCFHLRRQAASLCLV